MSATATAGRFASVLDTADQAFAPMAEGAGGEQRFTFTVAGRCIRLRFAGPALAASMSRAFAHLATPDADPDLEVLLWDSASTGAPEPVNLDGGDVREFWRDIGDRRLAVGQAAEGWFTAVDLDRGLGLYWYRDAAALPFYDVASPLRFVLGWWLGANGRHLIHAGAVGRTDGGVLLVGRGGSGKSTTCLSCLTSDSLRYASDDYTVLEPGDAARAPIAHSIYGSGKVEGAHVDRLPHLRPTIWNATRLETEKATVFVVEDFPEHVIASFPIRAVVAPRIAGGRDTSYRSIAAGAALAALAPSTILQLTGSGQAALEPLVDLLRQVPSFALDLGEDVDAIPQAIDDLLGEVTP